MKYHKFLSVVKMLIFNLLIILTGCTVSTPLPTPSSEGLPVVSTIVISREPSTPTPLSEPSLTASSTVLIPTITATTLLSTPTITSPPQPTGTETPVPIPAPPGASRREQVLWLLETNNGCQLPCWWGIVPGQTEWPVAKELLTRFYHNMSQTSSTPGLVYYEVTIPLPPEIYTGDHTQLGILVRSGIVESIDTPVSIGDTPPGYLIPYTLSAILTNYGDPTEVWVATYSSAPGGGPGSGEILPFVVVLFYRDLGIAALYYDNGTIQEGVVQGCPQQDPVKNLNLWSPTLDLTFEEAIRYLAIFNYEYLSLEESTEIDVAAFYETFKNPDNTTCLETPADLWH